MIDLSEVLLRPTKSAKDTPHLASPRWVSENLGNSSELLGVPVDRIDIPDSSRLVFHTDPHSPGADRFRLLRMRLREMRELAKLRSLIVTSPLPEDGKSTVTLNLATALAEGGERSVLVIEADLHRPGLATKLGLEDRPGLVECLKGTMDPLAALRRIEPLHWCFLHAGSVPDNPTELLQLDSFGAMMKTFSGCFDWILVDTPPVVPLTDALSIAPHVDTSLLVVRADCTPKEAIKEALSMLGPKHVLGMVLNGAEGLNRAYAQYTQYYGSKRDRG